MRSILFSLLLVAPGAFAGLCEDYNTVSGHALKPTITGGNWSDPATWGGILPAATDHVMIRHPVAADDALAGEVQIYSTLTVTGYLEAHGSVLVCDGGTLAGTEGEINFVVANDRAFASNLVNGPVAGAPGFHPGDNGLWATAGSTVNLHGPEVTPWVDAAPAGTWRDREYGVRESLGFGSGLATLETIPTGWAPGDTLLLVTEKGESDTATLESINGNQVTYSGPALNGYVLEFNGRRIAPKVANLSRRFQIYSGRVTENDTNHRAHTAYLAGSTVTLRHVELRNLGPRQKLGRYPVHWHHARTATGGVFGSSIWQDVTEAGSRFVVPHIVNGITVQDNVGYRSQGHGYFMEEVQEFDNRIVGNLSVDVRLPEELENVDSNKSSHVHHFWLREGNEISGNVAAGHNFVVDGSKGNGIRVQGIVLLPSSVDVAAPQVGPFECLGCGLIGGWSAVADSVWTGFASAHALVAGFRSWDHFFVDDRNQTLIDPLLLINGNNDRYRELFSVNRTLAYNSRFDNTGQVFLNFGGLTMVNGDLAGETGIHSHYQSQFVIRDTTYQGTGGFIAPSYFETDGLVLDSTSIGPLFDRASVRSYTGKTKRFPPGWPNTITVQNTTAGGENHNATYTAEWLSSYFESTEPTDLYRVVRVDGVDPAPEPDPGPVDPEPEPLTLEQRVLRIEKLLGIEENT